MEGLGASSTRRDPAAPDLGNALAPAIVVAALKRILESEEFRSSQRSRDFLSYVVTETLAGRGHRLKERTVARYAMGRDGTFNGATDSGARVQATRLRAMLDRYYAGSGDTDPVVIELGRGRYVPTFAHRPVLDSATREPLRPGIAIVGFDDLRVGADGDATARALSDSLVRALATFPRLRVVGAIPSERFSTQPVDTRSLARLLNVEYVLTGQLLSTKAVLRLCINLYDGESGVIVWSDTFESERTGRVGFEDQDDVVRRVAATVGDVRGVVSRDIERHGPRGSDALRTSAVLAFHHFADSGTRTDTEAAADELEAALAVHTDDVDLLAMAAWVDCFVSIMGWTDDEDRTRNRAEALACRALALDPRNAHAHQTLAGVALLRGVPAQVRHHVMQTVELSPANASLIYTSGVLLLQIGDWESGIEMIRESNRLNPFHPGYQHVFLGLEALVAGDDATALAEMSQLHHPDDVWGPFLRFLALAGQGYDESARHELAAALVVVPELLDDDAAYVETELRDAPLAMRVELRRRVLAWLTTHPE